MRRFVAAGLALAWTLAASPARAEDPDALSLGATTPDQVQEGGDDQFRFLAYFLTRLEATNVAPVNDLLQGRVVGRLFGSNTTQTTNQANFLAEQRLIPFFIFEPRILDRFARLRTSFEINWTWGDSAYGVGGNFGGAFSGRQINIETQNVEIEFRLHKGWYLNLGLQRLWDNVRNPYNTFLSTVSLTGNRLAFWGSDAVGVSVYGQSWGQQFKLGGYILYENKIQEDDHVLLFEALTSRTLPGGVNLGGGLRWVRDTSGGAGGVSVLGQGPGSPLAEYDGAYRFPTNGANYHMDVAWLDLNASFNPELAAGRWGGSAFVVGNFGDLRTKQPAGNYAKAATIAGVAANLRLGYRYGNTRNDLVVGELIFSSGNKGGIADGKYTGVITGNTWGAPGAPFISSGAYLLLPHATVVNRFYAAVFDISNLGYGLSAATLNVSHDLWRNKLTAKVGGAAAWSNVAPSGGGHFVGVEANAMLVYRIKVFFAVELHGAYLWLGDFYDSSRVQPTGGGGRPINPWTTFADLKWLMF